MSGKNRLVAFLILSLTVFFVFNQISFAQQSSIVDLQKIIDDLKKQIESLTKQITTLQVQVKTTGEDVIEVKKEVAEVKEELKIARSLRRGDRGPEVEALQKALAQLPEGIYPEKLVTGFFGERTEEAIRRLQDKQKIVSSGDAETTGYGLLGPRTLAKINELITQGAGQSGKVPPGLLKAPGLQEKQELTAIPAIPATPATPAVPATGNTSAIPAISATPATAATPASPSSGSTGGTIDPSITITSPNGGEQWLKGSTYPITWTSTGNITQVTIELRYKDTYGDVKVDVSLAKLSNTGSWGWTLPANQTWLGSGYYIRVSDIDSNIRSDSKIFSIATAGSSSDTTPPSTPTNVVANPLAPDNYRQVSLYLSWTASTDNIGVVAYKIYRDGKQIGVSNSANYNDICCYGGMVIDTTYNYTVSASDAAGNVSDLSASVSGRVSSIPKAVTLTTALFDASNGSVFFKWTDSNFPGTVTRFELRQNLRGSAVITPWPLVGTVGANATTISITAPSPGVYDYYVIACNTPTGCAGSDALVVTVQAVDTTPPVISAVSISSITQTGAIVSWTTNESADSKVVYTNFYGPKSVSDIALITNHSMNITGLSAGTAYTYHVESKNASGISATNNDQSFTTLTRDYTPPVIQSISETNITANSVTINYTTDEPTNFKIDYGPTVSYGTTVADLTNFSTTHAVVLSSLQPNTTYHYWLTAADVADNQATGGDRTFTTANPITASMLESLSAVLRDLQQALSRLNY
jgi:peptidoglycan hydrolase-like protein with peptidoglycan-binding domain/fibronectin type 3 domain-containing protein